jgi:hypothetical protein
MIVGGPVLLNALHHHISSIYLVIVELDTPVL